ncbi:hypothetical protein QL285_087395 [Trifolium repens]|nr:hypothetical protein QL285_087395 [Trifolium repens]
MRACLSFGFFLQGGSCSPDVTLQTGFPDCSSSSLMAFLYSLVIFLMVPVSPNHSSNTPFLLLLRVEALCSSSEIGCIIRLKQLGQSDLTEAPMLK